MNEYKKAESRWVFVDKMNLVKLMRRIWDLGLREPYRNLFFFLFWKSGGVGKLGKGNETRDE